MSRITSGVFVRCVFYSVSYIARREIPPMYKNLYKDEENLVVRRKQFHGLNIRCSEDSIRVGFHRSARIEQVLTQTALAVTDSVAETVMFCRFARKNESGLI